MSKRAAFYIDGFNLYHGIVEIGQPHLKWLSIMDLAKFYAHKNRETLEKVHYFSALASHMPQSEARHLTYLRALKSTGVIYDLGKFKMKKRGMSFEKLDYSGDPYATAKVRWVTYEEKETDVNIAIQLIKDAMDNVADVFYVVSADTDLAPAVKMLKARYPHIEYIPVLPPNRAQNKELKQLCSRPGKHIELKPINIAKCRLPDHITDATGSFTCPVEYEIPPITP